MSLAFRVVSGPSRALRRCVLAAHLTGGAGAVVLCSGFLHDGLPVAAGLVALAAATALGYSLARAARAAPEGELIVDAAGAARWRPAGQPASPLEPTRWHRIGGLAWVEAHSGGARLRLLLGRDRSADESWRCLSAWLRWLDRGGQADRN